MTTLPDHKLPPVHSMTNDEHKLPPVFKMSTAELEAEYAVLEDHECTYDDKCAVCIWLIRAERELDARELWDNDDPRVRESVGNYNY